MRNALIYDKTSLRLNVYIAHEEGLPNGAGPRKSSRRTQWSDLLALSDQQRSDRLDSSTPPREQPHQRRTGGVSTSLAEKSNGAAALHPRPAGATLALCRL